MHPDLPENVRHSLLNDLKSGCLTDGTYDLIGCYLLYWEQMKKAQGFKHSANVTDRRILAYWGEERKNLRCKQTLHDKWKKLGLSPQVIQHQTSSIRRSDQLFVESLRKDGDVQAAFQKVNNDLAKRFNMNRVE